MMPTTSSKLIRSIRLMRGHHAVMAALSQRRMPAGVDPAAAASAIARLGRRDARLYSAAASLR
jgi:hypothetical protein